MVVERCVEVEVLECVNVCSVGVEMCVVELYGCVGSAGVCVLGVYPCVGCGCLGFRYS